MEIKVELISHVEKYSSKVEETMTISIDYENISKAKIQIGMEEYIFEVDELRKALGIIVF